MNAHLTANPFASSEKANAGSSSKLEESTSAPPFFSSLNPESPSWENLQVRARTGSSVTPIRPPPGLECGRLQYGVPFGCGSSDGGSVPGSPYQTAPSVLDVAANDQATPSPFLPFGPESFYVPHFENVRTTLPFSPRTHHRPPYVKDNPFATSSDDDDDVDGKIAAELQELGGQMVGSILDF